MPDLSPIHPSTRPPIHPHASIRPHVHTSIPPYVLRRSPIAAAVLLLTAALLPTASSQTAGAGHTITLRASTIDITATRITATGSPVLTSDQGTMAAQEFTLTLDKQGRATSAAATGGVRFSLVERMGPYRTAQGACSQVILYPTQRRAVLQGALSGSLQGPNASPINLTGFTSADLYGGAGNTLGRFVLHGRGVVTTRT